MRNPEFDHKARHDLVGPPVLLPATRLTRKATLGKAEFSFRVGRGEGEVPGLRHPSTQTTPASRILGQRDDTPRRDVGAMAGRPATVVRRSHLPGWVSVRVVALNGERRVEPSIWSDWTGHHCESSLPLQMNEDVSQSKPSRLNALPV